MARNLQQNNLPHNLPRRRFLQGLAAGGIMLGMPWGSALAASQTAAIGTAPVLSGNEFDLVIGETLVNFTGTPRMAMTVNGSIPGPTLRWREGQLVTIRVTNRLPVTTSIHWHGILLDYRMDGVPGMSFMGIAPGETFTYQFKVAQAGTYWYHSHSGFQEQQGMYGAIVIEPAAGEAVRADRDYVITLSDWTDEDPAAVLRKLKINSGYYNYHQPTVADFMRKVRDQGLSGALDERRMWNEMRMSSTDLADVSGATYTYLMNGITPAGNWNGLFKRGERLRLRFINSAAMTFFDLRIPGLQMTVIQADGQPVEPVTVDEIRLGVAETYDVLVTPKDDAYTLFAQAMDRSGYACGTISTQPGMRAPVPAVDVLQPLTMLDMMGEMQGEHAHHGGAMAPTVRHASTEFGPEVDMRVDNPRSNLNDPGVGLRDNGRRVLTYADLHSLRGVIDPREPEKEIELHLTGNMSRYTWSIDGVDFAHSTPVHFPYGKRLRVVYVNDTMMNHPMHLHGMWSDLESEHGQAQLRKHTIIVQPAQRIAMRVSADALGRWAWHCHLMYHMDTGMFREVVVA